MAVIERRAVPRLDVADQVRGQLIPFGIPITLRDMGAGGFSAETAVPFPIGAHQRFRFFTSAGLQVVIEAEVVHSRSMRRESVAPCYVTGFSFVRESMHRATNVDVLLDAVTAPPLPSGHPAAHVDLGPPI